jgi:autotransporter-associated beta strand protein
MTPQAIRPAFDLDLDFAVFASSAAEGSGKSAATLGKTAISWTSDIALTSLPADGSAIKYTFLVPYAYDEKTDTEKGIKTPNFTLKPEFKFSFTDASHDNENQFISGWVHETNAYAKIAQPDEDGKGSFTLTGLTSGTYTISLFGEEANNYQYSDFISIPAIFRVVFKDTITDLTLLSDVPFGLDGGKIILTHQDKDGKNRVYTQTWTLHKGGSTILVGDGDFAEISDNVTDFADSGGLTKAGAGTLELTGANDYSGGTEIKTGTLSIASDANLGNGGTHTLNGGTLKLTGATGTDATFTYAKGWTLANAAGNTIEVAKDQTATLQGKPNESKAALTGDSGFTKTGEGTLILSGANTYEGNTTISKGTLKVTGTLDDSSDSDASTYTYNGTITLADKTALIFKDTTQTLGGVIGGVSDGNGSLTVTGGTLTLSGSAQNTYGATTVKDDGTLQLTGTDAYTRGWTLEAKDKDGDPDNIIKTDNDVTFSGALTGEGGFTKTGTGKLKLTAAHTYSGATIVKTGILSSSVADTYTTLEVKSEARQALYAKIEKLVTPGLCLLR